MKRAGRDEFEGALNDVKSEKHSLVLRNVLDFLLQVRQKERDFATILLENSAKSTLERKDRNRKR